MLNDEIYETPRTVRHSKSKHRKKSTHRHKYEQCVIKRNVVYKGLNHTVTCLGEYCTICGKTQITKWLTYFERDEYIDLLAKLPVKEENKDE